MVESKTASAKETTISSAYKLEAVTTVALKSNVRCYTKSDAIDIAKVLYNECRGVKSVTEQACVAWVILNRVDNEKSSIHDVVRKPYQFAYWDDTPIDNELLQLSYDVLGRWKRESKGESEVGRVIPKDYMWFVGNGENNIFRNSFAGDYKVWDYSMGSPYDT